MTGRSGLHGRFRHQPSRDSDPEATATPGTLANTPPTTPLPATHTLGAWDRSTGAFKPQWLSMTPLRVPGYHSRPALQAARYRMTVLWPMQAWHVFPSSVKAEYVLILSANKKTDYWPVQFIGIFGLSISSDTGQLTFCSSCSTGDICRSETSLARPVASRPVRSGKTET
jgi:hypothetical protein